MFISGRYRLPRIPRVSRAPADLPHVVYRDCQFHRRRRWSLGLLSCVSALLNSHQTPPPSCAHPYPEAFIVSFLPLCFLCAKSPFQFFQGQELNWILLSFETLNNVLTVKRASASVFFTLAPINTDNGGKWTEVIFEELRPSSSSFSSSKLQYSN